MKRIDLAPQPSMRKQKYEPGIGTEIEIAMMNGVVHRGRGSLRAAIPVFLLQG